MNSLSTVLKPILVIISLVFITTVGFSQLTSTNTSVYPNTWYLTIGGTGEDYPWWGLEVDEKGYVYVLGDTTTWRPLGYSSIMLNKISRYGENTRSILIYGNGTLMGRDLKVIEGVMYAVGQLTGYGAGGTDAYLVSFHDNGTVKLFRTYGSPALDVFWRLTVGRDGSLYLIGYTMGLGAIKNDGFIVKTDLSGGIKWSIVLGGSEHEFLWDGITWYNETEGKEYLYVVGQSNSFIVSGGYECLVVKIDENGLISWSIVFGTPLLDRLDKVLIDEYGYIYVVGRTDGTPTGRPDVLIAKISPDGALIWVKNLGGDADDIAYSAHLDKDYMYIVGSTTSFYTGLVSNMDAFLALVNRDGDVISFVNFGGVDSDVAYGVKSDAIFVYISGFTASFTEGGRDFFVAKMNKEYLLEKSPSSLKWVYNDFPEDVNVSRVFLDSKVTSINSSIVYLTFRYPTPVVLSYTIPSMLIAPVTHIATTTGNPPADITTTTLVLTTTETRTTTTTVTRTVVDIITDTVTIVTTKTETDVKTITEKWVETTTYVVTRTIPYTYTETVTVPITMQVTTVETKTTILPVTHTLTERQTVRVTETVEVQITRTDVPLLVVATLLGIAVGLITGWFKIRKTGMKIRSSFFTVFISLLFLIMPMFSTFVYASETNSYMYKIDPEVLESIHRGETLEVIIVLRNPDYEFLRVLKHQRGVEEVKRFLKSHAYVTQTTIKDLISKLGGQTLNSFWITNAVLAKLDARKLPILASNSMVEKILPNFEVRVMEFTKEYNVTITSTSRVSSWGLERIGVPEVWRMGYNGSGIRICVIDTGVDVSHPALNGKLFTIMPGNPYYPGGWIAFDSNGRPYLTPPQDTHGHGTHVSGTALGGDTENILIGVAPGATLMHVLALPFGRGTFAQTLAAIEWAADPYYIDPLTGEIKYTYITPHVVSMSFGARDYYGVEYLNPIRNLLLLNIIPVAAIGNGGPGTHATPGNIWGVFGIGATDEQDNVASFSSGARIHWPYIPRDWPFNGTYPDVYIKPDFTAPGVRIISSTPGGGYAAWSGTSMATPHVSGLVALILEATKWNLYPVQDLPFKIYEILRTTSKDLGTIGQDTRYGWGIVDAYQAVKKALVFAKISGVRGVVYDSQDNEPIPLVNVRAYNVKGELVAYTHTNSSGHFILPLDPGRYTLVFSRFGYFERRLEVEVQIHNGTIIGAVLDILTKQPIVNALVRIVEANITTYTDVNGFYQVSVQPGRYKVIASAEGYFPASKTVIVSEGSTVTADFQLYPLSSAATLKVHVKEFFSGMPIESAQVAVLELGLETVTDTNGIATLNMIPPGVYTIVVSKDYYATRVYTISLNPGEQYLDVDTTYLIAVMTKDKSVFGEDIKEALISQGYPSYAIELIDPLQVTRSYKAIIINYLGLDPGFDSLMSFIKHADNKNTSLVFLDAWGEYYNFAGYLMYKYNSAISAQGYPAPRYRSEGYVSGVMIEAVNPNHTVFSRIVFDELSRFYVGVSPTDRVGYAAYQGFTTPKSGLLEFVGKIAHGGTIYGYSVVLWSREDEPDRWAFLSIGGSYHWSKYVGRGQDTQYSLNTRRLLFNVLLWCLGFSTTDFEVIQGVELSGKNDITERTAVDTHAYTDILVKMERVPHGWVVGKILALDKGTPLVNARIEVVGTPVLAFTNASGVFRIWLPEGRFNLKIEADGYYSIEREVSVRVGELTYIEDALVRKPRAAVMLDYNGQITLFLRERGWYAKSYREWSELLRELDFYDVLVLAGEYVGGEYLWPDRRVFESIINRTLSLGIGIVFLNSYFEYRYMRRYPYGINLLYFYYRNPASIGAGYDNGPVYYEIVREHPILADYNVGDRVYLIYGGDYDYAWFSGWDGEVLAYIGAETVGIRGIGIGIKVTSSNTRWVLLAGLAPQTWTNMDHWSSTAMNILYRAVSWAAVRPVNISVTPFNVYVGDTISIEIPPLPGVIYSVYLDDIPVYRNLLGRKDTTILRIKVPNLPRGLHVIRVVCEGLLYGEAPFFVNTKLDVIDEEVVSNNVVTIELTGYPINTSLLVYIDDNYLTTIKTPSTADKPLRLYITIPNYFAGLRNINVRTPSGEVIASKRILIRHSEFESKVINQLSTLTDLSGTISAILKRLENNFEVFNSNVSHGILSILHTLLQMNDTLVTTNVLVHAMHDIIETLFDVLKQEFIIELESAFKELHHEVIKLRQNDLILVRKSVEELQGLVSDEFRHASANILDRVSKSEKSIVEILDTRTTILIAITVLNLLALLLLLLWFKRTKPYTP